MSTITLLCLAAISQVPILQIQADPETEAQAAVAFLERQEECDRPFIRMYSTYTVPAADRSEFETLLRVNTRFLTLSPNRRVFPSRVPNSLTLWWMDMRSFYWNDAAWRAVASRDKTFREPWVTHATAERLRLLIGERQPSNFHVVGLIDGMGLYRRTYQTTETSDYYDLLFAEQRFPLLKVGSVVQFDKREFLKTKKPGENPIFTSGFLDVPKRFFTDFPKDRDEWRSVFIGGLKVTDYEGALKTLKSRHGAVIKGMEDAKAGTSFVARNNRLIWMAPALSLFGAVEGETFDVKETSGKRDLEEHAFTDQDRDKHRVIRDGGELLFQLPAGDAIATLVINAQGKRVEEVPPDIAIHTRDSRDRRVRNGGLACMSCHADAYGWIPLSNVIEEKTPNEVDVRFKDLKTGLKDRVAAEDYDAFFIGWQDGLKPIRDTVKVNWLQATGTRVQDYKDGWTGAQLASISLKWKHRIDDPVTIEQACLETGAPQAILRIAASKSALTRSIDVARMFPVPRPAWDKDVFPEIMKLLVAKKERLVP